MEILKVSSKSNPNNVAGAITNYIKETGIIDVQVIGAGAINQLVKAIIISRGYLSPHGIEIGCIPSFVDLKINNETKTGIKFSIYSLN
jgi:stage V sporulation protein S